MNFKIIVDSGCELTDDMKSSETFDSVPLNLQVEEKQFIDDTSLNINEYLECMSKSSLLPKTAAPSPEKYFDKYKGADNIFVVTLSSHLSGSYNSAVLAKDLYLEEFSNKFIHVFDSFSASIGETLIALKIDEIIHLNTSTDELIKTVQKHIDGMKTYFILERFDNLVKTGRLNPYVAKIAAMLSFKPICGANNGKTVFIDKARGYKKTVDKFIDIILKEGSDFENKILGISHVSCLEKAIDLKEEILKKIKFKDVIIVEARGLSSTYADRGGLIIAF